MSAERLSIVHVIARLNVGGAALHVLQLAHEQARRGHDVVVVAGTLAPGEKSMEYVADDLDVVLSRLPVLQRELSLTADPAAILALRRLIRERRPDVLHTHTAKAGATGRLAAMMSGDARPSALVHTYHGHVLSGYFSRRWERVFRKIERVLAYATGTLVAVSSEVRDDLISFGVARAARFAVVPYGFDLPEWSERDDESRARIRSDLGLSDETFAIGWAGRFTAIKRPFDLVRTLKLLRDDGVDAALVLVGDGEDRPQTEALARELGVSECCHFVGFQRQVREWYAAVDASLLTSANEGTPVVAIESLAAMRPVVATRAGGTGSVVVDGENGYLRPIGDIAGLAEKLAALARDPVLRERLGRQGSVDVRARFTVDRMTDELEAVYRRLLPDPSRRPRVLVLNQYYAPGIEATAQLLAELCEELARDFEVTVVTGMLRDRPVPAGVSVVGGVRTVRVRSASFERVRPIPRAINYLTYLLQSLRVSLASPRPDVVMCMTDPPVIGAVAVVTARRFRSPVVVVMQDVFPEIAVELGRLKNGALVGLLRFVTRWYLRRADRIIAIGDVMRAKLIAKGASAARVEVIPNWVDTTRLHPEARRNAWSAEHGLNESFVVMHSGNLGHAHDLDNLVYAAALLGDLENLQIVIIGSGARQREVRELVDSLELQNVRFLPYQDRRVLRMSLSSADVHFVGLPKGLAGYVVPSRFLGILAVGRPVVAAVDEMSETARVVQDQVCGIAVPPGDPEQLAAAIRAAYNGEHDLAAMGARGRRYVEEEATKSISVARYRAVLYKLTGTRPAVVESPR